MSTLVGFSAEVFLFQFDWRQEDLRVACKSLMASFGPNRFAVQTLVEVGQIDDIIWGLNPDVGRIFFEYMDYFHCMPFVRREPLQWVDILKMQTDPVEPFPREAHSRVVFQRLNAPYYTVADQQLVCSHSEEGRFFAEYFDPSLERLYQLTLAALSNSRIHLGEQLTGRL